MPDRTAVPRAYSTVLAPLQRNQTEPQSHVLQFSRPPQRNQTGTQSHVLRFCPFLIETRQDHSPMSYSSVPSLEKPDRTTVPRARSAVLPPRQRSQTGPQSHVLQFCHLFREARRQQSHVLQFCPLFREARRQQWPHGATLQQQLWGNMEDLLQTTTFIHTTGLTL